MITARQKTTIAGRNMVMGIDLDDHHLQKLEYEEKIRTPPNVEYSAVRIGDLFNNPKYDLLARHLVYDGPYLPKDFCLIGHLGAVKCIKVGGKVYINKGHKIYTGDSNV